MNLKEPKPFRVGMKANTPQLKTKHNQIFKYNTSVINCMLELGKYGRINNMNMYHLLRKAKNGLCSDILLREPQECTPAEIRNSVVEAGRSQCTLVIGSSLHQFGIPYIKNWSIPLSCLRPVVVKPFKPTHVKVIVGAVVAVTLIGVLAYALAKSKN